jgi:hypothetical protein
MSGALLTGERRGGTAADHRLTDEQLGHIRHISNLSRLPRGDWHHMSGAIPRQEDFNSYRYQLGYMSLALSLAHVHRLPGAPVVFRRTLDRLIERMLEPDVWWYWRDTSTAGGFGPFTLPQLESRTDPVAADNIMYSAYLQVMTAMYTVLFDDRKYEQPGSLTFDVFPVLWGRDRREAFAYDQKSLNERIYWNMVSNGYLGVACEPFCVFQMCNQVPILGFRLHDHLYGGDTAGEVTAGYLRAWQDFGGGLNANEHFVTAVIQPNALMPSAVAYDKDSAWADGWLGTLLNMWRPELVRKTYADKIEGWLDRSPEGTLSPTQLGRLPGSEPVAPVGMHGELGWLAAWASEMGDEEVVRGLTAHADAYMNPSWDNGGLYYPRQDNPLDEAGRVIAMPPIVSNAMLPFARLNVEDGLKELYENPWTDVERSRPALTGLSDQVDVRRAWYPADRDGLDLTLTAMRGAAGGLAEVTISRAWKDDWILSVNGRVPCRGAGGKVVPAGDERPVAHRDGEDLVLVVPVEEADCDLELTWGQR